MRAMILAAGRGERMGDLTRDIPKPLLRVHDKYLIEYAIDSLKKAGITEIVINISYHAEQIKDALGSGKNYGVDIIYSEEKERLETGGGIFKALPHLGKDAFVVMSSDIMTDFPVANLFPHQHKLAHLLLVPNPTYHPRGDFNLQKNILHLPENKTAKTFTFGSLGIYHPTLFAECAPGYFRLMDIVFPAVRRGEISGEVYDGFWYNIGTPEELSNARLALLRCCHPERSEGSA